MRQTSRQESDPSALKYSKVLPHQYVNYCKNLNVPPDSALVLWEQAEHYRGYVDHSVQNVITAHVGRKYSPLLIHLYQKLMGVSPWRWGNE